MAFFKYLFKTSLSYQGVRLSGYDRKMNFIYINTAQKMKFSIKGSFSKCDQIHNKLRIRSHVLKKSFMENFMFCAVCIMKIVQNIFPRNIAFLQGRFPEQTLEVYLEPCQTFYKPFTKTVESFFCQVRKKCVKQNSHFP